MRESCSRFFAVNCKLFARAADPPNRGYSGTTPRPLSLDHREGTQESRGIDFLKPLSDSPHAKIQSKGFLQASRGMTQQGRGLIFRGLPLLVRAAAIFVSREGMAILGSIRLNAKPASSNARSVGTRKTSSRRHCAGQMAKLIKLPHKRLMAMLRASSLVSTFALRRRLASRRFK
jgi:hypothetical protein